MRNFVKLIKLASDIEFAFQPVKRGLTGLFAAVFEPLWLFLPLPPAQIGDFCFAVGKRVVSRIAGSTQHSLDVGRS